MAKKTIITAAVTGAWPKKENNHQKLLMTYMRAGKQVQPSLIFI